MVSPVDHKTPVIPLAPVRRALVLCGLAAIYFAAGRLGMRLAFLNSSATPVWPSAGIALAGFLILGTRIWPAILVGAFLVNYTVAGAFVPSFGIAVSNTLEGLVGTFLVNRFANGRECFGRPADIIRFAAMKLARELGVIVTAHCENADAIDALQKSLLAAGRTGPEWHGPSRPPVLEADGVHHLCTFAELLGTHVYTVHTSCDEAVRAALAARYRGVNVWIESVIPHFVLDEAYAERPDFEGAKYVMSPPLRAKENQAVLWNGVKSRAISTIGTDHAPFRFKDQKQMGRDAFTRIPNGIASIQERVDLVHTHGVCAERISLRTMVDACSTQAAQIFGLYPRKGAIQVGSDADLVVYDPAFRGPFSQATSHSKVDYNAYEGWERIGRASVVTVRGAVQARDGKFVGTIGRGQFLQREPTH